MPAGSVGLGFCQNLVSPAVVDLLQEQALPMLPVLLSLPDAAELLLLRYLSLQVVPVRDRRTPPAAARHMKQEVMSHIHRVSFI